MLRVTGTVGGPSGFGVWLGPCIVDMSGSSGISFTIGGNAVTTSVPWTSFGGGSPAPSVAPTEIVGLRWDFEWETGMTPYPVDVTLDDVVLFD